MLLCFACLSFSAVRTKGPTIDEPMHAVGAWTSRHLADPRINPEDPALWQDWASLMNGPDAPRLDKSSPQFARILSDEAQRWPFVAQMLYRTPGVDADSFIARSRFMMLILGIALGTLIARWSWRIGGPACAVAATALYCFDPGFLAHSPLVKNDVAISLVMLATACAVWRAGIRLTVLNAAAVCLLCGVAVTVKFSGLLIGPIVAVMLGARACLHADWPVVGRSIRDAAGRALVAACLCAATLLLGIAMIWAVYRFTFAATPDGPLDPSALVASSAGPDATLRALQWVETHRLLPQAWLYGLGFTHVHSMQRNAFLMGEYSTTGWAIYFAIAMLTKSPLALLAAAGTAVAIGYIAWRGRGMPLRPTWTAVCLAVPPAAYFTAAVTSHLNIGVRHILPVYPFAYIAIGLAASWLWQRVPRLAGSLGVALLAVLLIETLSAYPDYIAFFNRMVGGPRGGIAILGDSNLDWGQDLPALHDWQRRNPQAELTVLYFGPVDPGDVGLGATRAFLSGRPGLAASVPQAGPGRVLAVSATHLQGIYLTPDLRRQMLQLRQSLEPMAVLGGTIYLYDLNTPAAHRLYPPASAAPP
jgi:hypothetical protein